MVAALGLPALGTPPAGLNTHFGLPSVAAIRADLATAWAWVTGASPWGKLPQEPRGTAAGHPHEVPAAATRANRGAGYAPGTAKGQLPPYGPLPPKVARGLSGMAVTGFSARTSVRVASKSTATSDYYRNADGSVTRRLAASPINYEAAPGTWEPVDTTVVRASGGRWREKANSVQVSFAGSGSAASLVSIGLVSVGVAHGASAAWSLASAASVAPTVSGSAVSYHAILPETDLVASPTSTGVRESLVLRSASAPHAWLFPLRLTGLRIVLTQDGAAALVGASGRQVAVLPRAAAFDSASATGAVSYSLTTHDGAPALRMTLDEAWLRAPGREFPVTVESLAITGLNVAAGGTTYADTAKPGDNSTSPTLAIGARNSGTEKANTFLQFPDVGLQGSHVQVHSAAAELSVVFATTCKAERFDIAPVLRPWTPSSITSYPGPAHGPSIGNLAKALPANICGTKPVDPSASFQVTVPLSTSLFQGWSDGSTANNGLEAYASTADSLHWKQFTSVYAEFPPVLVITYTGRLLPHVTTQTPADGTVATTLMPRLTVYGQIDPGLGRKPQFDFQVDNASGTKVADSGLITSTNPAPAAPFGPASWTVPAGKLHWGQSYYWTVQAFDGLNFSPGPVWHSLSLQVPQPVITSSLSQNTTGHGVDPSIGNYTTSATDANVATVGPSLTVQRDYNSRDPRTAGALGAGWSTIFDARATEQHGDSGAVSSVVITYPDGSTVGYGKNPDGTFTPADGRFSTLRVVSGGGYTLTDKNDTIYSFKQRLGSGAYGITSVTDASGRAVDFGYSGGRLTTMTSAVSGRALHLTWTTPSGAAHPHVSTVATDPVTAGAASTTLTWTYGYHGDELTRVCPPGNDGKCSQYSYTAGSDFYNAVLDEDPHSYWPLSEASGTTAHSAVLANEGKDNGTYSNVTLGQPGPLTPSSAGTAAGFNGASSYVSLPNLNEGTAPDQTIALWFKTSAPDGVLFSYSDDPIAACAPPANPSGECSTLFNPALYIGSDGKLNAALWYDARFNPIHTIVSPAAVDDGKWHYVVLTGSPAKQVLYLDGKQVGTEVGSAAIGFTTGATHLTHVFLGAGFLGGLWPDQPSHSLTHAPISYLNGSIANAAFFETPLAQSDVTLLHQLGTTPASLLSSVTQPSGNSYAAVSYDPKTARVTQLTDENGGTWKYSAPTASGSSQVYRSAVLSAGPVDYYRLGDPAGTSQATNEVNGGTATYSSVTLGVPGRFADATAASFNGSSSYLTMPQGLLTGSGKESVSLWFKTTKTGEVLFGSSRQPITAGHADGGFTPELYIGSNGDLEAEFWNGTAAPISGGRVNNGKWHNVVLAAGGTAGQVLYLDGRKAGSSTRTVSGGADETNVYVGTGFLGGDWPNQPHMSHTSSVGFPSYFAGSVSDVAFYYAQLSGDQVAAQYQAANNSSGLAPVTTVTVTDPGGKTITDEYDPVNGNRMIASIDALGEKTTYGYDTSGFLHTVTNPNGAVQTTGHDARGNILTTTSCQDQAARKCSTVYQTYYPPGDSSGQLTKPDPRNDQVLTVRDGRSTSASDPAYETSYTYNSAGDVTRVTTPPVTGFPHGRSTTMTYSDGTSAFPAADSGNVPAGLPVKVVSPGGATQKISYFHDGDVARTTNADGLVTRYTYDRLGRVLTETQISNSYPAGLTTSYSYDGQNRVSVETDPPVTNRVTHVVHTPRTTTTYDPDGDVLSQTVDDLSGGNPSRTVRYSYTRHDQVASHTDAVGNTTTYTYDAYGNKASETDPNGNTTDYTYDPNGHLLDTILLNFTGDPAEPAPPVNLIESSRAYDPAGRLASITDAMGNTTSYTYTDNGLLATTTRTNPSRTSRYVQESDGYDAAGNVIRRVTGNGATVTDYTVDAADRTTAEVVDPAGLDRTTHVSYTPDDQPAVTTLTGPSGATEVTSQTYDPMGNPTSRTVSSGGSKPLTTRWALDQRGLPTSMTDPDGNTTSYVYDQAGKLAVTTQPPVTVEAGGGLPSTVRPVTMTGYDAFGDATQSEDPNDNVTTSAYDGDGHLVSRTLPSYTPPGSSSPITATTRDSYDGNGNLIKQTDPLGNVTTSGYDQLGDQTSVNEPNGGVTRYTYDNDGNKVSQTGPTGARTQYTYDFMGRQVTAAVLDRFPSPQASVTTYSYTPSPSDPGGAWLSAVTSPDGVTTTYGYDAVGDRTSVINGAGDKTSSGYDNLGRQTAVTAPDGTRQTVAYDALSDIVKAQNLSATGNTLTTQTATYNGDGDMLSATDPRGDTTTFSYDATGLLQKEVQPVSATSSITTLFSYDAAGNETRFTDGRGNSWIYTYNPWNLQQSQVEPATQAYPNAADSTFTTSYDADARPVEQTQPGGVALNTSYDSMGDVTRQSGQGADASTATRTIGYDLAGNMTSAATESGQQQNGQARDTSETFSYNDRGELLTTSGSAGSSSFSYNGDGLAAAASTPAGTAGYTYDTADRLKTLTDPATGTILSYGYNSNSELTSISYGLSGDTQNYGYNSLHELTSDVLKTNAGATIAAISYGYDANGNLIAKDTTKLAGAANNSYTYDEANRLTSWNNGTTTTGYAYDASGNRTRVAATTYTYDARDELTSGGGATYRYTANGTLATTSTAKGDVQSTFDAYGQQVTDGRQEYTYDALGRTVAIAGSQQSQNTSASTLKLTFAGASHDITSDGRNTYTWTPDGTLTGIGLVQGDQGAGVLAMTDQHTDVIGDFTAGGGLAGGTAYDPLGDIIATAGAPAGLLGYQSALTDPATGKVEMGSRWYNPANGNFTSRDAAANSPNPNSVAANPFAYAGDNPLTNIDPTGGNWFSAAVGAVTNVWHSATSAISTGWNDLTSAATSLTTDLVQEAKAAAAAAAAALARATATAIHYVSDVNSSLVKAWSKATAVVTHTATQLYNGAVQVVHKAWNLTTQVAKAGASFVQHHAADIASFAAGAAVFIGCEAVTAGVGTIGCAAAAGAVGSLVSYGMSCGSSKGGCTVGGALVAGLSGAAAGVVGGALIGPLGGALADSVLGDVLPSIAVRGLTGALAGGAAGAVGSATAYAGGCALGASCSWSGLASATESGAVSGAVMGGVFGAVAPESPARSATEPGTAPEGEPTAADNAGAARTNTEPANNPAGTEGGNPTAEEPQTVTPQEQTGPSCGGQSFAPHTKVLLATGAAVAISMLKPGDKVLATNAKTGKSQPERVAAVLVHYDTDLYDVLVRSGGHPAVIQTTSSHLFWDPSLKQWIPANHFKKGEHLKTSDGSLAVVDGGTTPRVHDGWMWDLTVPGNNDHDFYVQLAGEGAGSPSAVLVHNYNCITTGPLNGGGMSEEELLSSAQSARDSLARQLGELPQRTRPAAVTAGYNLETGQYAAAANSAGACAEMCVIDQLGGDASKVRFTSAVRPRALPGDLQQVSVCLVCESRYTRAPFVEPGTTFKSDFIAQFYEPFPEFPQG
jgi:RHS repeat-associated protein